MPVTATSPSTSTSKVSTTAASMKDATATNTVSMKNITMIPWRDDLERSIRENVEASRALVLDASDENPLFHVSLATIKPFGRPANRTVLFRGFLVDRATTEANQLSTSAAIPDSLRNRLADTIVFTTDVRGGSVDDLLHGSRFGEVCWVFPHTKEQFRLSGTLHLVVSPDHALSSVHQIPPPFSQFMPCARHTQKSGNPQSAPHLAMPPTPPSVSASAFPTSQGMSTTPPRRTNSGNQGSPTDGTAKTDTAATSTIDWEQKRLEVWDSVSHTRRGTFSMAYPGRDESLMYLAAPNTNNQSPMFDEPTSDVDVKVEDPPAHASGLHNFCLLLLEVDGVDHLQQNKVPHGRTKFRRNDIAMCASLTNDSQQLPVTEAEGDDDEEVMLRRHMEALRLQHNKRMSGAGLEEGVKAAQAAADEFEVRRGLERERESSVREDSAYLWNMSRWTVTYHNA